MRVGYGTIIVKSMEESVAYYKDVLGFSEYHEYRPAADVRIMLMKGDGDAMIELIESSSFPVGIYSIGLEVQDMDAAITDLKAKGAKITMEPVKTLVGRCAFIEDPNGARLALICHD